MSVLEEVETELDQATARAWQLVKSTDPRVFTVRPRAGSWSAAECLSHLSLSTELFLPVLKKAFEDAREKGMLSNRKPKMDLIGRTLRWFLEPPIRQRGRRDGLPCLGITLADQLRVVVTIRPVPDAIDHPHGPARRTECVQPQIAKSLADFNIHLRSHDTPS